jgi:hypothetical protein
MAIVISIPVRNKDDLRFTFNSNILRVRYLQSLSRLHDWQTTRAAVEGINQSETSWGSIIIRWTWEWAGRLIDVSWFGPTGILLTCLYFQKCCMERVTKRFARWSDIHVYCGRSRAAFPKVKPCVWKPDHKEGDHTSHSKYLKVFAGLKGSACYGVVFRLTWSLLLTHVLCRSAV